MMLNKMKNYLKNNMESVAFALAYVNGSSNLPYID